MVLSCVIASIICSDAQAANPVARKQFHSASTRELAAQNSLFIRSELRNSIPISESSGMLPISAGIAIPQGQENEYVLHEFRNLISKLTAWLETIQSEWIREGVEKSIPSIELSQFKQAVEILRAYGNLKGQNNSQSSREWLIKVYDFFGQENIDRLVQTIETYYPTTFGPFMEMGATIKKINMSAKMIHAEAGLVSGLQTTRRNEFVIDEIINFFSMSETGKVFVENHASGLVLNSDELALFMVLKNFIRNALDAGASRIEILANLTEPHLLDIRVIDNGDGINPETLPHIFEVGFTTKPKGIGSGLGLPLSKQMVERRLSGSLGVRSLVGRGTRFTIRIPVNNARSELRMGDGIRFLEPVERKHSSEKLSVFKKNGRLKRRGKDKRSVHRDGDWHQSVKIFIVNEEDGSVLFQKRFSKSNKPEHDGKLHVAVSGHVSHGESVRAAAIREFEEELGVQPELKNLVRISKKDEALLSSKENGRIDNERTTIFLYRTNSDEINRINKRFNRSTIEAIALISPSKLRDIVSGSNGGDEVLSKKVIAIAAQYPDIFSKIFEKHDSKRSELRVYLSQVKLRPYDSKIQIANRWLLNVIRRIVNKERKPLNDRTRNMLLSLFGLNSDHKADQRLGFILSYDLAYDESLLLLLDQAAEALGGAQPIFVVRGNVVDSTTIKGVNKQLKHLPKTRRIQLAANYADARSRLITDYGVREYKLLLSEDEQDNLAYYLNQGFEREEIKIVRRGDWQQLFQTLGITEQILATFQNARLHAQFA